MVQLEIPKTADHLPQKKLVPPSPRSRNPGSATRHCSVKLNLTYTANDSYKTPTPVMSLVKLYQQMNLYKKLDGKYRKILQFPGGQKALFITKHFYSRHR